MANVQSGGGKDRSKPERIDTRVDFTPMVDMMLLLLTFFMFVTTLSKPTIMNIVMPTDDEDEIKEEDKDKVPESKTITILLGENGKVFYYFGKPKYEDYKSLNETTFASTGGIRDVLLERNADAVRKMRELKREERDKKLPKEETKEREKEIKSDKDNAIVIIKAMDTSVFENLVDALDEMAICSIGTYSIVNFDEASDGFLVKNYETKGQHAAEHDFEKK